MPGGWHPRSVAQVIRAAPETSADCNIGAVAWRLAKMPDATPASCRNGKFQHAHGRTQQLRIESRQRVGTGSRG